MPGISSKISRHMERQTNAPIASVVVDGTLADSEGIDYRAYTSGHFTVPSGSGLTTITWHAAHEDVDGSYIAAYTEANAAVTMTVAASRRYPIPAALAGAHWIRGVGNTDGAITNVCLKS